MSNGPTSKDPGFAPIAAVVLDKGMKEHLEQKGIGKDLSDLPNWPAVANAVNPHVAALNAAQKELLRAALLHALEHGGSVSFKGRQTTQYDFKGGRGLEIVDGKHAAGGPAELLVAFGHN